MSTCCKCACVGVDKGLALSIETALNIVFSANEDELDDDGVFLFANNSGLYCFVCLAESLDTCIICLDPADELIIDIRCDAKPVVCSTCLQSAARNHMYSCYSSGCMTAGEFAYQEYQMSLMEESEEE
jgi:hypothetical protein